MDNYNEHKSTGSELIPIGKLEKNNKGDNAIKLF